MRRGPAEGSKLCVALIARDELLEAAGVARRAGRIVGVGRIAGVEIPPSRSRSASPPCDGSTFGLTSIAAARPVAAVVEGRPVAPGVVKRPGSEGSVGVADWSLSAKALISPPAIWSSWAWYCGRERVAQRRIAGERARLDRHRRSRAGDRHAVDGDGVAADAVDAASASR